MDSFSPAFNRLVGLITRMPGIGARTAERLAWYILKSPPQYARQLAAELAGLHEKIIFCSRCGLMTEQDPCVICTSARRDQGLICVVENPGDALRIEATKEFRGVYHVLMGAISPLNRIHPEDLRITELLDRIREGGVREIILATNPTVEGDTTAYYIAEQCKDLPVQVSRIARGLPVGSDLEYADSLTLTSALSGREKI
ncbi:MAG TPA: recombination mediator RecR [Spirochaetota bacterium]|nr:recombination mediator RecR [Spirochaetota bacterium]HPH03718.1 recombination mediator RecR [Spirochaetota bacterium]